MRFYQYFDEIKWHLLACLICFALFPILNALLPADYGATLQMLSNLAVALVIDITSFLVGYVHFRWYYPILAAALYSVIMLAGNVYTIDSIMYSTIYYAVLSFIAAGLGKIISVIRSR